MALQLPDYETVFGQVLSFFRNRWPGKDDHSESFIGKMARAIAMSIFGLLQAAEAIDADAVPSTRSSSEGLQTWAFAIGIPADTEGTYGSKAATAATGGRGACTGTNATVFPDGALATAADGVTVIALSGAVTIPGTPPGTGAAFGQFIAVTKGSSGNLPAGAVLTWQSPPSGAFSTVTLAQPLAGALDAESGRSLLGRIWDRFRKPPKGGAAPDYRSWVESVDGVYRAYGYPLRGGMATVQVVIASAGSGLGRRPSDQVRTAVDTYVRTTRPVTVAGYATLLPFMAPKGLVLRMRLVPSGAKYRFDWTSAGTSYTVGAYVAPTAAAPASLTLNPPPPADLASAIQFGRKPRLQLIASGANAPVIPLQLSCTAVAGSVLTIENGPAAGLINVGDAVFSGGPLVVPAATALLQHVDGLGPSRQSGLADVNDYWEDTLSIARMIQLALDLRDPDDVPLCRNVLTGGTTIDGIAQDRQANDSTLAGPELLYAGSIAITD